MFPKGHDVREVQAVGFADNSCPSLLRWVVGLLSPLEVDLNDSGIVALDVHVGKCDQVHVGLNSWFSGRWHTLAATNDVVQLVTSRPSVSQDRALADTAMHPCSGGTHFGFVPPRFGALS